MGEMENRFKASLYDLQRLSVTWELIPGRGAREKLPEAALESAARAAKSGLIDAVTVTGQSWGQPCDIGGLPGFRDFEVGDRAVDSFYVQGSEPEPVGEPALCVGPRGSEESFGDDGGLSCYGFSGSTGAGV